MKGIHRKYKGNIKGIEGVYYGPGPPLYFYGGGGSKNRKQEFEGGGSQRPIRIPVFWDLVNGKISFGLGWAGRGWARPADED